MIDFLFGLLPGDTLGYDIETYPNTFTFTAKTVDKSRVWRFELSPRKAELHLLRAFLSQLATMGSRLVGFNNISFDYPVVHFVFHNQWATVGDIYDKAMSIIRAPDNARFAHLVPDYEHIVPQVDLFKIHHFDNRAKSTSLKVIEFNMGMTRVEDLPFDVGINLTVEQVPVLLDYNEHDVDATIDFYHHSSAEITMRERLSETFQRNMINMSNTKIGETILVYEMEKAGIKCFENVNGRRMKRQTERDQIILADAILPYIHLEHPAFRSVLEFLRGKVITETKGTFADLEVMVDGVNYKFGTGGIHASIESGIVHSDTQFQIVDVDVASFYPNLAIQNGVYPAHLGTEYCDAYKGVYETRKTYPKKTPENNAYKEALNASYGNSNNQFSVLFDPLYTMTTTLSGQLSLCMLVEQLIKIPGLRMIQANTDGVTYQCPRGYLDHSRAICRWWEQVTKLELEEVLYKSMWIRDVNSYLALSEDGKVKRIGAYAHETALENPGTRELPWHKDWSARVVAKAAEAALVRGENIESFVKGHQNVMDFMLRTKVPRSSLLMHGGVRVANTVRYYIGTDGKSLEKVMPSAGPPGQYKKANGVGQGDYDYWHHQHGNQWNPDVHTKNKSTHEARTTRLHNPRLVTLCNNLEGCSFSDIDYDWYIQEAKKLVEPLR